MCVNVLPTMPFEGLHTHAHILHKKAVLKKVRAREGRWRRQVGRGGGEREGKCAAFCQIAKASRELELECLHCARVERNICWSAGGH